MTDKSGKYKPLLNELKCILTSHVKQIVDSIIDDYMQTFKTTENLNSLLDLSEKSYNNNNYYNKLDLIEKSLDKLNSSIYYLNDRIKLLEVDKGTENIKLEINEVSKSCSIPGYCEETNSIHSNKNFNSSSNSINDIQIFSDKYHVDKNENVAIIDVNDKDYDEDYDLDEEDEEELFEVEIGGVIFCTNDDKNGEIFEFNEDDTQGEKVGYFKDGKAIFNPI